MAYFHFVVVSLHWLPCLLPLERVRRTTSSTPSKKVEDALSTGAPTCNYRRTWQRGLSAMEVNFGKGIFCEGD